MARYLLPITLLAALLVPAPGSSTPSTPLAGAHEICCRPLLLAPCCYRPLLLRPRLVRDCCFPLRSRIVVSYYCCGPVSAQGDTTAETDGNQPTPAETPPLEDATPVPDLSQPPQEPEDPDADEAPDATPDDPDAPAEPEDPDDPAEAGDTEESVSFDLHVPAEARVTINGYTTRQPGAHRHFMSRVPAGSAAQRFTIQAELVRDGQHIRQTRTLSLRPGESTSLSLDLLRPGITTTTLTLQVPAGAIVILQGQETSVDGKTRVFRTRSLPAGETWKNYTVEVQQQQDGTTVSSQHRIDLVGGQSHQLTIAAPAPAIARNR
ncbi:MAG: TIGR03000 domain-containing protein [Pirellulaceae bacterium]